MKILVVDDELLIRESIVMKLVKSGYNDILEAENGIHALKVIEMTSPDVIISDIRMPKMDGIQLLTEIQKLNKDIPFIIISGYDLFEYAQKALINGAFSYILKPIKDAELDEVMTLASEKIQTNNNVQKNNTQIKMKADEGVVLSRKQFFLELLNEIALGSEYIEKKFHELNIKFQFNRFYIVIISIDNYVLLSENLDIKDRNHYKLSIENVASKFLANLGITSYSFPLYDGQGYILNFNEYNLFNSNDYVYNTFSLIKNEIRSFINLSVSIGIGNVVHSPQGLRESFDAARKAINMRLIKGTDQVFINGNKSNQKSIVKFFDFKAEQDLLLCFSKCDKSSCSKIIEAIYLPLKISNAIDIDIVSKLNFQVILLIYKIINQLHIDPEEMFGNEYTLYNEVNAFGSIDSILSWFDVLLEKCINKIIMFKQKGNTVMIDKALEYVHLNFNKDINLETVANHVHMSASYFSKLFKLEAGEHFVDYLVRYRISRAKIYLKEGVYRTHEVSRMAGFNDDKYFYKTFKKYTGLTPGEYKVI